MIEKRWPPVKEVNFIQLALIKQSHHSLSCKFQTIYGRIDEVVGDKTFTDLGSIFSNLQDGSRILLEGRPGSGKTTLMLKVSSDWARGEILQTKLVLFVQLRRLSGQTNLDLHSLLAMSSPILSAASEHVESLCSYINKQRGKGVVFALDGLDEYAPGTEETNFVYKLIKKVHLPRSTVIVSSRPAATYTFRKNATRWIEVVGFLEDQVLQYISSYYDDDDDKAQQLKLHMVRHPNVMNMAYLPLHCAMLTYLYDEDEILPETQTEFYKHFTLSTLLRSICKRGCMKDSFFLSSFKDLLPNDNILFCGICKLAFDATVASKQVFSFAELESKGIALKPGSTGSDETSLGLVVIDRYFMKYGRDETYTFLHLTFQEFLAAVHIAGLENSEQLQIIENHYEKKHLSVVWRFLCGMLDYTSSSSMDTFKHLMRTTKDELFKIQCCHESQQPSLCTHVINISSGHIEFADNSITSSDCVAIGYAIVVNKSESRLVNICFNNCTLSSEGTVTLLQQVGDHPFSLQFK